MDNRNELDNQTQAVLENILSKAVSVLLPSEVAVLRARRSYLSSAESKAFESVLKEDSLLEMENTSYESLTNAKLLEVLKSRGISVPKEASKKADYIALLEQADGELKKVTL